MTQPTRRDLVGELLRGPMLLAVTGSLANTLNLAMNLVLARLLDEASYGAVVEQTNIYMVLVVVGMAVLNAVIHRDLAVRGEPGTDQGRWVRELRLVTAGAALLAAALAFAVCRPAAALLSYPHPVAIAQAATAAALWVGVCVERGLLQARGNYPGLAANILLETVCRVACILGAVAAGLGVNGAGLGLVLGAVVGTAFARRAVARTPRAAAPAARPPGPAQRTRDMLLADTGVALATLAPIALLQNIDVVIVGWRNPGAVGGYAAISTACKVPVFIGLAVAHYLLAEAARRRRAGRAAGRALAMALGVVVAPGVLLAAVAAVAGRQLVAVIFGPAFADASRALWVLALANTCLSVTLLFAAYLLGANYRRIVWGLAGCTPVVVGLLVVADGRILRTAGLELSGQAFTAGVAAALVLRLHGARSVTTPDSHEMSGPVGGAPAPAGG